MDERGMNHATGLGWMIDASHNVKDPLQDLLQSVEAIKIAYAINYRGCCNGYSPALEPPAAISGYH